MSVVGVWEEEMRTQTHGRRDHVKTKERPHVAERVTSCGSGPGALARGGGSSSTAAFLGPDCLKV